MNRTTTNTNTYNGWKNRATWNVALYLNNDEGWYTLMRRHFEGDRINAASAREFCWIVWPCGNTPDGDELTEVHWPSIARMIREAVKD